MKSAVDTEPVPTASGSNESVTGIRSTAEGKRADETQITDTPTEEIEFEAVEAVEAAELGSSAIPVENSAPPPAAPPEEPRRKTSMPPPLPAAALRARLPATRPRAAPPPSLGLSPLGQLLPPAVHRDPNARTSVRSAVAIVGSEEALAELDRVTKRMRERDAYLAELEQAYAQRSDALLKAENELDKLRAELAAQIERVSELEDQLKQRATAPAPRASQPPAAAQRPSQPPGPRSSHDLTRIRGIGPGYARALYALGVSSFAHIAAWTPDDIANFGKKLKTPAGRIERDRWVDQARELLAER